MTILFIVQKHNALTNYRLWIVLILLGLSFRNTAKALSFLLLVKISHHVSIWNWIQKSQPKKYCKNKKILEYSCIQKDETAIKVGSSELIWL